MALTSSWMTGAVALTLALTGVLQWSLPRLIFGPAFGWELLLWSLMRGDHSVPPQLSSCFGDCLPLERSSVSLIGHNIYADHFVFCKTLPETLVSTAALSVFKVVEGIRCRRTLEWREIDVKKKLLCLYCSQYFRFGHCGIVWLSFRVWWRGSDKALKRVWL